MIQAPARKCKEGHVEIPANSFCVIGYDEIMHSTSECISLGSMYTGLEIPKDPNVKISSKATHVCKICKQLWTLRITGKNVAAIAGCTHPFENLEPIKK